MSRSGRGMRSEIAFLRMEAKGNISAPTETPVQIEVITLTNGMIVDSQIPSEVILLVLELFEFIDIGDLAIFRSVLGASDGQDVYRNMLLVHSYFYEILNIEEESVHNAIAYKENFNEVYYLIFKAELPPRSRNLGLHVREIRLHPIYGEWMLEAVVTDRKQRESVYGIQYSNTDGSWAIGITNASSWLG